MVLSNYQVFANIKQNNIVDSLKNVLKNTTKSDEQISLMIDISMRLRNSGDLSQSEEYAQKSIDLSEKTNNKKSLGKSYFTMGWVKHYSGDYTIAQTYYVKAMEIQEAIKDEEGLAFTLTTMGIISIRIGNMDKSIEYYNRALSIKEKLRDSSGTAALLNNIAVVYFQQEKYDEAINYLERSSKIYEAIGNTQMLSEIFSNIGSYYYEVTNDKEKGVDYFLKAHNAAMQSQNPYSIAMSFNTLSSVELEQKDYNKALFYISESLKYAINANAKDLILQAYETYSKIYSEKGDYKNAYTYQKLFIQVNDSIFNSEKTKQIMELSEKYESEKKQKEIELLNKEKEKQAAISSEQNKKKNIIIISVITGLCLLLIFSSFLFNRFKVIKKQKFIIEVKQKDITDSINYAKRIQEAILPIDDEFKTAYPDSFVLFKSKDIVSGDFYWISTNPNEFPGIDKAEGENWRVKNPLVAAVDCTGHGVPGSLMSMMGNSLLNKIVDTHKITKPSEILNTLRTEIINSLKQHGDNENKDGMDIALCAVYEDKIEFSGANNPIYIIRKNGSLEEIKGDKMPISYTDEELRPYINHAINMEKGDSFYIFTDGYADQFGGKDNKKFKYKQLKDLLVSVYSRPMEEQKQVLNQTIEKWKGTNEQTDDILIIGIRI